jgi:nucleotide-binding universal stress UspA family protein
MRLRIQKILVPVDFSPHSAKAVNVAVEFAKAFSAEIHLLHAYSLPIGVVGPYDYQIPANILGEMRESAARRIDEEVKKVANLDVKTTGIITEGVPTQAIVEAAEQIGADLVVMGTRGLTGLKHVVLGSVAERTIRHAPCPVLTVHDPDEE